MARFIELTKTDNTKILVNKDLIVMIKPYGEDATAISFVVTYIHGQKDNLSSYCETIHVLEKYNWLKDKLL